MSNSLYKGFTVYNNEGIYESERYKDPIEGFIQVSCEKIDTGETLYQAICRKTREETDLHTVPVYLITDKSFNCDLYITDIGERVSQQMEFNKNRLQTFYTQAEQEVLANQAELTLSLIKFKRDIRRVICKKGKQSEYSIYKIIIIECLTCGKMVKGKDDHYYLLARETDPTILTDKPWQDTIYSGPQTLSELTKEQYLEFQDGYETLTKQEAPISQAYQQGLQLSIESENNDNEELKQDLKMDDQDEKSREYYQKHRADYKDLQAKQKFRRIIRWREYKAERLNRRKRTKNTAP